MTSLVEQYKPEQFDQVVGQDIPVRALSRLILGGQRRSALLVGSVGSGKTSLAHIYGRALNCIAPTRTGSPCGTCDFCRGELSLFREYDTPREGGEIKDVRALLEIHRSAPVPQGRTRVIFFDEVHHLQLKAFDALLKSAEDDKSLALIFATTESERVPTSMKSRLWVLEVKPLPEVIALPWLQDICAQQGLDVSDEALRLMIGICEGRPRDLLNALDQLCDLVGTQVTLGMVREHFNLTHTDVLPRYFLALAQGDLGAVELVLKTWREPFEDKVRWLRSFLTAIYYRYIIRTDVQIEPAIAAIDDAVLREVVTAWRDQAGDAPGTLRARWHAMMEFWDTDTMMASESKLQLHLARFHDRLVLDHAAASAPNGWRLALHDVPEATVSRGFFNDTRALPRSFEPTVSSVGFISVEEVKAIVDRASFFIQEYGRTFNAAVDVRVTMNDEKAAMTVIETFSNTMLDTFGKSPGLGVMRTAHREQSAIVASLIGYLPELPEVSLREWISRWASPSIGVEFTTPPVLGEYNLRWHWRSTMRLLGGLERHVSHFDDATNASMALRTLLKVPSTVAPIGPLGGRLVSFDGVLNDDAMRSATANKMLGISAMADRAWAEIASGWELAEHFERTRTRAERDRLLAALHVRHRDEAALAEAVRSARASWPDDPRDRLRGNIAWWVKDA